MNISSLNFPKAGLYQTNVQAQNTRAPKMRELTCDTVSFGKNEDSGQYPASSVPSELLKGLEILYKYDYNKRFSDGSFKDKGKTALMYLLSYNDTKSLLDIAKLFGKETLKQVLTYQDVDGNTALFHASIAEQTKALLDAAPDKETLKKMLTQQNNSGDTALMWAESLEQVQLLLNAAPDEETLKIMLTQQDSENRIPLMHSVSLEETKALLDAAPDKETLKQMLTHRDVFEDMAIDFAKTPAQMKAILDAAPDDETLKEMLLKQDQYTGKTLLMKSPTSFQSMLLLDAAPDDETRRKMLTQKCSDGKTAYNYASYHQEKFLLNQAYRLGVYDL